MCVLQFVPEEPLPACPALPDLDMPATLAAPGCWRTGRVQDDDSSRRKRTVQIAVGVGVGVGGAAVLIAALAVATIARRRPMCVF